MTRTALTKWTAALSGLLAAGMIAAFWILHSQLALAQGADSLFDVATASMLLWAVRVGQEPPDAEHPFGHHRAEPIAALVAAVMAGVLAIEVIRSALGALWSGDHARLELWLVGVFGAKVAAKVIIGQLARASSRRQASPAMDALAVDARNDVLVSTLAIAGFVAAKMGWPALDAWLAIPAGLMIGWAGYELAAENISLLMGRAPDADRIRVLEAMAREIEGVRDVHDVRAQFLGTHLQVYLHVVVAPTLSVLEAHDIGEAVEKRLEGESDVHHCFVHIDIR